MSSAEPNFPPSAAAPAAGLERELGVWDTLLVLTRREFWEHRILWVAPVAIAAVIVLCALFAHLDADAVGAVRWQTQAAERSTLLALVQWAVSLPEYLVMVVVLNFYLVDCLFAERRDRSILFWKSLPISDGMTVGSKLFVALVVVPLGVYLLALLTGLLFLVILLARAAAGHFPPGLIAWDSLTWLKVQLLMLLALIVAIAWYAPLAAYLMLISAWARRNAFMWTILPPLFAVLIEKIALGTDYVGRFIEYRTWGIWRFLHLESAVHTAAANAQNGVSVSRLFAEIHFAPAFANPDLWLGLAATAALALAAARLRRYREEG
ncbi:MAG TPA: hypothetical protein VIY54_11750 [Steroidobacteraceae bacterium]